MKLERDFSKQTVARFFGPHSSKEAAQLKREDPTLYAAIRRQAQADGLVGNNEHFSSLAASQADFDRRHSEQRFSTDALRARAAFSEADCRELLTRKGSDGNSNNLATMKTKQPDKYNLFRLAAESYGLVSARPTQPEKKQAPKDDGRFQLGQALRDRFRLPEGYMVDSEEFTQLTNLASELDAAKHQTKEN